MTTTTIEQLSQRATITVPEAARLLGISRASAYAAAKSGDLPVVKIGRRVVVPVAELQRLLRIEG